MKITYKQMINSQQGLSSIAGTKLPVKEAVKVARLIKVFSEEYEIYNKERKKICVDYGDYNVKEDTYEVKSEEGIEKLKELLDCDFECEFEKILIPSKTEIEAATLLGCEDFIEIKE